MGQTLSEPVTEKHSTTGEDERFLFAVSEMQGWRIGMEDAHTNLLKIAEGDRNAWFAVYDGHGGSSAAKFAGENVHKRLASEETYAAKDYRAALRRAFLGTDEDLRADSNFFRDPSGCTAVTALITEDGTIYVANAGDSRSVLGVKGEAKPLSFDHKPQNEGESSRIRAAGGYVEYGRVNGNLALSRAIGDFEFKQNHSLEPEKQIVTSDPEITVHEPTDDDEFLVLACDGIWDCLTSQQVIDICRREIANRKELKDICESVIEKCLAPDSDINGGVGCDNMTFTIVALLRGRTKQQWYDWIATRVEQKVGYETPKELPMIYSAARISVAKERWSRASTGAGLGSGGAGGPFSRAGASGFGALARVFGSNITFHPSGGISGNNLMFENDESSGDEYDSGEEGDHAIGAFPGGLKAPPQKDVNKFLREQLEELKEDNRLGGNGKMAGSYRAGKPWTIDDDGDATMADGTSEPTSALSKSAIWSRRATKSGQTSEAGGDDSDDEGKEKIPIGLSLAPPTSIGSPLVPSPSSIQTANGKTQRQGEAPLPPKVNGVSSAPAGVPQLKSTPGGDAPSAAVKVEGLMDKSEDPLKAL